jgi:hypothetical protein
MTPLRVAARSRAVALLAAVAVAVTPLALTASETASAASGTRVVGADISWPQCPDTMGIPERRGENKPMPSRTSKFVVVGLTNGPGFYPNPCLKRQMRWIRKHHVYGAAYAVTTFPKAKQMRKYGATGPYAKKPLIGRLRNVGYNQAQFNVATMEELEVKTPVVWVDVEPYALAPWTRYPWKNKAVVDGAIRGYQEAGYRVGFYSTQYLWREIMGDARYGFPEWRTAGQTSMSAALSKCTNYTFQGGRGVIAQWWSPNKDYDVMCPGFGRTKRMNRWFHKY